MTPEQLLDMLETILRPPLQGTHPEPQTVVARVPEGLVVLRRDGGDHLLLRVNVAVVVVA